MPHFEWTITVGDVLWIGSVLFSAGVIYATTRAELKSIKTWINAHQLCADKQDKLLEKQADLITNVKEALAYMQGQMSEKK